MGLEARGNDRRVLVLGVVALAPAALVTLLLVHQPAIGHRALAPMLRRPLAFAGLGLAAVTVAVWVLTPNRRRRAGIGGLAWAGVAVLLCIGPLVQSTPRPRLFAFDADDGVVVWASTEGAAAPAMVEGELVVTDVEGGARVGLDPTTGEERWRHHLDAPATAGVTVAGPTIATTWLAPGERLLTVARVQTVSYAYVVTPGADQATGASLLKVDADGSVRWRRALPATMAVQSEVAALGADERFIVVAGGERIGVLDAGDGHLLWSRSVVDLGKSRSFAMVGAVQQVIVADSMVFLAVTAG